jgi:signal transduction histidine kinase
MENELRLLMLEDDPADAALIQKLLQRSGIRFSSKLVSDEKEFLKALDENNFDAVLADNALPQYSSLKALEAIKEKNPFVAFILVTGTVSEEFAVSIIQQGADDYILKTNLTRLPAAINKVIENKKTQKAKYEAELEMQELNERLRSLAAHLQNVREEEQMRIAREIHDELGQMLTTLKIDISFAESKMNTSAEEAKKYLEDARSLADNTLKTVRRIAADLRPSVLDDMGLIAGLEWQSSEFEKHNSIRSVFYSSHEDIQLEKSIATHIYRIYQEALTNIVRHAHANTVTTDLIVEKTQLILSISDNGKGFLSEEIKSKKTLGLLGISERAILIKGQLAINSEAGKGTTITITVPLKTNAN